VPRPPLSTGKTTRLVLVPRPGEEAKIKAFKEICARDGYRVSDELSKLIDEWLIKHNYPPGNPQLPLTRFTSDSGVQIPTGSRPTIFKVVLGSQPIRVTERDLQQIREQWHKMLDSSKQSWRRILQQIDHPTAREIRQLEKGE